MGSGRTHFAIKDPYIERRIYDTSRVDLSLVRWIYCGETRPSPRFPVPVKENRVILQAVNICIMSNLGYRIVSDADLPLLLQYRQECGWGEEAVKKNWKDPDRIYCVFESVIEGEKQDVGMGCWYLHQPEDLELACRDTHVVHIASLFIPVKFQGSGTGTKALQLLERVSVERYGAKIVTLDTLAYFLSDSECKTYIIEHPDVPGRNVEWYTRKGYTKFRPNGPLYPLPTPDDADRKLTAVFMSKTAEAILAER